MVWSCWQVDNRTSVAYVKTVVCIRPLFFVGFFLVFSKTDRLLPCSLRDETRSCCVANKGCAQFILLEMIHRGLRGSGDAGLNDVLPGTPRSGRRSRSSFQVKMVGLVVCLLLVGMSFSNNSFVKFAAVAPACMCIPKHPKIRLHALTAPMVLV